MSANENETIADIVAEFREMVHKSVDGIIAVKADVIADRIEEAMKREIVSRRSIKIPIEIIPPCNASAMREAFKKLDKELQFCERNVNLGLGFSWKGLREHCQIVREILKTALAEPPRNCDVGTAEEQEKRFQDFCDDSQTDDDFCSMCARCSLKKERHCELAWAQMPYESEAAR